MNRKSNFHNSSSADLNVSAELSALRDEVDNRITGKFYRELDSLKTLSQQLQLQKMSSENNSDVSIIVENNLTERIIKLERDFNAEILRISERIDLLQTYIKNNARLLEDLDQERRSCCLIFQGVTESDCISPDRQILDIMKNKMNLAIPGYPCCNNNPDTDPHNVVPPYVISRAFRMGKPRTTAQISKMGPRPIMVTFGSLYFRDKVFSSKKSLRGTKLYICESLTRTRYELLQRAREVVGNKNAWSADGKVFAIINDSKTRIFKLEDLQFQNT
jgi:hypothetical protein